MEHHLAKVGVAGSIPVSRFFFLRRRQAKVPDSCLHEMKALWRPPDIEHEMRDGGGDAGWVVWRLAAYYPLFSERGSSLRLAPVGASFISFHTAFPKIDNLIMMITDISAIMGHKNSF